MCIVKRYARVRRTFAASRDVSDGRLTLRTPPPSVTVKYNLNIPLKLNFGCKISDDPATRILRQRSYTNGTNMYVFTAFKAQLGEILRLYKLHFLDYSRRGVPLYVIPDTIGILINVFLFKRIMEAYQQSWYSLKQY